MMRHSRATSANKRIKDWTDDYRRKTNLPFFRDALNAFAREKVGNGGLMVIGLVGSRNLPGVALRQAQSILRWDLRPSLWSHVFLLAQTLKEANVGQTRLLEVSLNPRSGGFPPPERNGVTTGKLREYDDPRLDANAALLAVSMSDDEAAKVAERAQHPNRDRLRYNLWESLGAWQGYLWSFGTRSNPLRDGFPIASSSFAEYCFEGISLDLTPGASERNSAPEHVWNAAKWWHEAFATQKRFISGYYVTRDEGCSLQSSDKDD